MEGVSLRQVPGGQLLVWPTQEYYSQRKHIVICVSPIATEIPTQGMLGTPGNNQRAGMKWEVEEKSRGANKCVFF